VAQFNADILLNVKSGKATSAVAKIEAGQKRIAQTTKKILYTDKIIVAERRKLLGLEGSSASLQRQKLRFLRQQKAELALQKRELVQINALDKKRSTGGGGVRGAVVGTVGAFAGIAALSGLASAANNAATLTAEVGKLGIALQGVLGPETAAGLAAIQRAATDFNQPIAEATRNFTQLSAAAVANGNSVAEIENLYRGLAAATKATGGNTEDLNGVLRAATQVLSKGTVQAEELRGQIGDRLPGAFQLFAEATGRTTEQLQDDLKKGAVSADEFVTDFADFIRNKFEPAAKKIGDSPEEAGARLTKALENANLAAGPLLAALGAKFQNFATTAINALIPVANYLNDLFGFTPKTAAGLKDLGGKLLEAQASEAKAQARFDGADNDVARRAAQEDLTARIAQTQKLTKAYNELNASLPVNTADPKTPFVSAKDAGIKVGDTVGGGGGGISGVDKAAREATKAERERLALTERQSKSYAEIKQDLERTILLNSDITDLQKDRLQTSFVLEDSIKRINETVAAGNRAELIALAKLKKEQADFNNLKDSASDFAGFFADAAAIDKELNEELTKTEELANSIGDQLSSGITDALIGAIDGTKSLGEAFQELAADILQAVGKALILQAITGAVGSVGGGGIIGGLFPGRASGGPVNGGSPYIVGEKGPELFIPGASGSISNNDQFEAARNAMGGSSSGSDDAFADNTSSISTTNSYMREREYETNNQTTAGSGGSMVIETQVINNVEYASVEQVRVASAAAAKQARAQMFSDMQNKPSRRAMVGLK
jgi:tape measure domain-containing protein